MLKKFFLLLLLSCLPSSAFALGQVTGLSGTIVDTDGIAWAFAPYTITFRPSPNNPNLATYNINGVPLDPTQLSFSGYTNSSGYFQQFVYMNGLISPSGSTWAITIS